MNTTWWTKLEDLDEVQKKFIKLPVQGRYLLEGPPGSGKTNLLLLRAQYVAGSGDKNILLLTYTKTLADFIRSGIKVKGLIEEHQIRTYHSWAFEHARTTLGVAPLDNDTNFDDDSRAQLLEQVKLANKKLPSKKIYSAIFVDEAQDLSFQELEQLLSLSDNVCICGDVKQGIYNKDGLSIADNSKLEKHTLKNHYRIGQKIAKVADRILPPLDGEPTLEQTSNYNPKIYGIPTAYIHQCTDRDQQFAKMEESLRIQLEAFKDETIGIICGRNSTIDELKARFMDSDLQDKICIHKDGDGFYSEKPVHILSAHSSKGTEFRAVHIFGAEDFFKGHLDKRELVYTAVTRARTALNVYRTGPTAAYIVNAFAEPAHIELDTLFPG